MPLLAALAALSCFLFVAPSALAATTITAGPSGLTNNSSPSFEFSTDTGTSFNCKMDSGTWGACTSPKGYTALTNGPHTFYVQANDDATPVSRSFTVDTLAPDTSIASGPSGTTKETTATFSLGATEAGSTFQCRIDAGAWVSCTSPVSYSLLADGSHTFDAKATDPAGNTDGTPVSRTWTVDTTPPETSITAGPSGTVNSGSPSFSFSASQSGSTFQCRLDAGAWGACTSPKSYSGLADGAHTFEVAATDSAGNPDPTPAARTWTVDTVAPDTSFSVAPPAITTSSASFSFTSNEAGTTFQCKLDTGSFTACSSPKTYTGLAEGSHSVEVRAIDAAGNVDLTPVAHTWTVDTVAPTTTLTAVPPSNTNQTSASFSFTSEAGATFQCRMDGGSWTACTSPTSYSMLSEGPHTFEVRATDLAGNVETAPKSHTWNVDLTNPSGATTAPTGTITGSVTVSGDASDSLSGVSSVTIRYAKVGGGAADDICVGPALSGTNPKTFSCTWSTAGLTDGSYSIGLTVTDAAGNQATSSRTVTLDNSAPVASLDSFQETSSYAHWSGAPSSTIYVNPTVPSAQQLQVVVDATDATSGVNDVAFPALGIGWILSPVGGVVATPEAGTSKYRATYEWGSGAADPANTTVATATDKVGKTSPVPFVVEHDIAGPADVTISTLDDFQKTLPVRVDFSTGTDALTGIQSWSIRRQHAPMTDGTCGAYGAWSNTYAPTSSPWTDQDPSTNGCYMYRISVADGVSNWTTTYATTVTRVDATAPSALLNAPAAGRGTIAMSGSADDYFDDAASWAGVKRVDVTYSNGSGSNVTICANPALTGADPATFDCSWDTIAGGVADGSYTVTLTVTDRAGNIGTTTKTVVVDNTPPQTSFSTAPRNVTGPNPSFSFYSTESGSTFECRIDAGAWEACTSPKAYSGLTDGTHSFEVRATDPRGNLDPTPASHTWTVDMTMPTSSLTGKPATITNKTSATFAFSSEPGATFECRLDGAFWQSCSSPTTYSLLSEGAHTFEVRAIDEVGNQESPPTSYTWTIDTTMADTAITAGPNGTVTNSSATFSFASEPAAVFECRLNLGLWVPCSSPVSYSSLAEGTHTFDVRATDTAGNVENTPARRVWTVDTTAPDATITSTPAQPSNLTTATFAFTAEPGATFECSLDAAAWASCTSPVSYSALADGTHNFRVRATDVAGNTDATPTTVVWTVDTVAPDTVVVSAPSGVITTATPTFTMLSPDETATFQCRIDAGTYQRCASPYTTPRLSEGTHTVTLRAIDAAGNADATPETVTFTVDTVGPDTTVDSGPSGPTASTSATFTFSTTEGSTTFQCRMNSETWGGCTSPVAYGSLPDGAHTFQVRAVDQYGNVDASPAARSFTVDTVPPSASFASTPPTRVASSSARFVFGSSEAGSTFRCSIDGAAFVSCPHSHQVDGLAEGAHSMRIQATDAVGNAQVGHAEYSWAVDFTPPAAPALVSDGLGADGATTNDVSTWSANWTAVTGVADMSHYEYCISSAPGCAGSVGASWTRSDTPWFSRPGLSLADDSSYVVCVRSLDVAGNASGATCSNGQHVSRSAAEVRVSQAKSGGKWLACGAAKYRRCLYGAAQPLYWKGSLSKVSALVGQKVTLRFYRQTGARTWKRALARTGTISANYTYKVKTTTKGMKRGNWMVRTEIPATATTKASLSKPTYLEIAKKVKKAKRKQRSKTRR